MEAHKTLRYINNIQRHLRVLKKQHFGFAQEKIKKFESDLQILNLITGEIGAKQRQVEEDLECKGKD